MKAFIFGEVKEVEVVAGGLAVVVEVEADGLDGREDDDVEELEAFDLGVLKRLTMVEDAEADGAGGTADKGEETREYVFV